MTRPYKLGQRQVATDQTRSSIMTAAWNLLASDEGVAGFTMETVARKAGVSRMTVYYQFESKTKLLESLCDHLAVRGGMHQMPAVFAHENPLDALKELVLIFARFWGLDRSVIVRVKALAVIDPEIDAVIKGREARRREVVRVLVRRLMERFHKPAPERFDDVVEMLCAVISFEMFQALSGADRTFEDVAPQVTHLVKLICEVPVESA